MSMPFLMFSCDRCSFSGTSVVIWGRFSYESPSGLVSLNRILGWCDSCQGLVPIEILPTLEWIEKLESDIAQNKRLVAERRAKTAGGRSWLARLLPLKPHLPPEVQHIEFQTSFLENDLREGRNRYNLLSARVSKPRCLICGSEDCFTLPKNIRPLGSPDNPGPAVATGVKHPGCGGTIMVQYSRDRISIRLSHRVYDREGRLVRINDED
jgi:hypothetical protein